MRMFHAASAALVLLFNATPAIAADRDGTGTRAEGWSGEVSTGVIYQEGDYGTDDRFETVAVPVTVTATKGRFHIGASLPYVRTSAPTGVIVSQGGLLGTPLLATGSSTLERSTREGIGDLTIQASVDLPLAGLATSLGTSVKLPTASVAKGLGTGKADYAVVGQVARPMGVLTPFLSLGYTVLGEPDGFDVHNTLSGSAGARMKLGARTFAALSYSYEEAATETLADRQAIGIGLGTSFEDNMRLSLEGNAGLSEGAPSASIAARIGFGF